jgi:hypothetical protein
VLAEFGDGQADEPDEPSELSEAQRRVQAWRDKHGMSVAVDPGPAVRYARADDEAVTDAAPEPAAV